jgi:hypothetical protein
MRRLALQTFKNFKQRLGDSTFPESLNPASRRGFGFSGTRRCSLTAQSLALLVASESKRRNPKTAEFEDMAKTNEPGNGPLGLDRDKGGC